MALPHLIKYIYNNGTDEVIRRGKKIFSLGYVELIVNSGFNDTNIPDLIAEKLKSDLNTTQFSDLTVIMSDGSTTTEYDYVSKTSSWNQIELSSTAVPAD